MAVFQIPKSQQWNAVRLHIDFKNGAANRTQCVDYLELSDQELEALTDFINAIINKKELPGCNKPSYTDGKSHAVDSESADFYKENGAWHYHCGPTYSSEGSETTDWWLPANDHGKASSEVIHYSKSQRHGLEDVRMITIFAFSRTHKPFPDHNSRQLPIRKRLSTLKDAE